MFEKKKKKKVPLNCNLHFFEIKYNNLGSRRTMERVNRVYMIVPNYIAVKQFALSLTYIFKIKKNKQTNTF